MSKGTVTIDIDEYNELRDFYKKLNEGELYFIASSFGMSYFLKENKALETFSLELENERKIRANMKKEYDNLKEEYDKLKYKHYW